MMSMRPGIIVSLDTLRLVTKAIEQGVPSAKDWHAVWCFVWECIGKAYENDCMADGLR